MKKLLATTALALLVSTPLAAQHPPLVQHALRTMEQSDEEWAFTTTTVEKGKKTVEKFDPSRPIGKQWTLVLNEGHAPTAKELADYAKKHAAKPKKKSDDNDELIRPGSLKVLKETAGEISYGFRLAIDDEPEMADLMIGTLTIRKSPPQPFVFEMANTGVLKPITGVKISRISTRLDYRAVAPNGPLLVHEARVSIRGKALLVKSLDQDSVQTFSDYRRVAVKSN